MSDNVNILIEKMNLEQKRKERGIHINNNTSDGGDVAINRGQSPNARSQTITVDQQQQIHADKAVLSLMKEHEKLKKRLRLIQQPDFLVNLKRDLRVTEEEIKQ